MFFSASVLAPHPFVVGGDVHRADDHAYVAGDRCLQSRQRKRVRARVTGAARVGQQEAGLMTTAEGRAGYANSVMRASPRI
jgi:hypothetical protein